MAAGQAGPGPRTSRPTRSRPRAWSTTSARYVVNPLTEGRWLRASTVKVERPPGRAPHPDRLHERHAERRHRPSRTVGRLGRRLRGGRREPTSAPKNVGTYLPPAAPSASRPTTRPSARKSTDNSQIALYFYKDKTPEHGHAQLGDRRQRRSSIPPNDGAPQGDGLPGVPEGRAALLGLPARPLPRLRRRTCGSSYPDGKKKLLLTLPRYDFNWQRDYTFAEPMKVPAGSKLIAHYATTTPSATRPTPTRTRRGLGRPVLGGDALHPARATAGWTRPPPSRSTATPASPRAA